MIIEPGIPANQIDRAVDLYWQAFGQKLGKVLQPEAKAKAFIARTIDPTHALCAVDETGAILGVAGFKTYQGALVGGTFRDLWKTYGLSSLWRSVVLSLLERDVENERFLMDGIFVAKAARGQGVGSALLRALYQLGREKGYKEIRLDVIDSNPRAKALYEREGFTALGTQKLGVLSHVFAFKSATTMVRSLKE